MTSEYKFGRCARAQWHEKNTFPSRCPYCTNYVDYYDEKERARVYHVIKEPSWSFFFDATENALTLQGYQALVNAFIIWAQPQIEEISRKLSSLVSRSLYDEMLKALVKPEEPGEE